MITDPSRLATLSPWREAAAPRFPRLDRDLDVDVVVVGGGITGVTAAWLCRQAGLRVALIERSRLAGADTGHTTAHLTCVTDQRLHVLSRRFGAAATRAAWRGGLEAIEQVEQLVRQLDIDCGFRRVPGYLHAPLGSQARQSDMGGQRKSLREDARLAASFGIDVRYEEAGAGLEVPTVRFDRQATFDPGRYVTSLALRLRAEGAHVFEDSGFEAVEPRPRCVRTEAGHRIRCRHVILATHDPFIGGLATPRAPRFQAKLALRTSHGIGARLPAGTVPDALYWDTADPYDYLRVEPRGEHQLVLLGGEDATSGEGDEAEAFAALERRLLERLPGAAVTHRWRGQVVETDDGLPYIGEHAPGEFIATGFGGNGMTFGTLAAMMARDAVLGEANPWADLFRVDRKPFHGGAWRHADDGAAAETDWAMTAAASNRNAPREERWPQASRTPFGGSGGP